MEHVYIYLFDPSSFFELVESGGRGAGSYLFPMQHHQDSQLVTQNTFVNLEDAA